jgi:dsRNA-specific ribonuclease
MLACFSLINAFRTHLFYMFESADEGVLATYRSAIVQNKHLANVAKVEYAEMFVFKIIFHCSE